MKQVININFHGRVVPIEVSAFDLLKQYTESLGRHFANEEGKEEIINDIESRIGELFQERLTNGATCITDDDVNAVIKSMGRPEEFEDADDNTGGAQTKTAEASAPQFTGTTATHKRLYRDENNKILGGVCAGIANYFGMDALIVRIVFVLSGVGLLAYILLWIFVPNNATAVIGAPRKKLYRDNDDKIIAGVCSGIGNYFGISSWIPRLLFALPFLSFVFRWNHWGFVSFPDFLRLGFSPGALIIYIILWLVIPEAFTTAEKLEMKGEKVDIDSIKNSVVEEMKGVQQRASKLAKDAAGFAQEKGKIVGAEISNVARRGGRSLGDIIVLMLKIFAYMIIGSVGVGLVMALFGLGIISIGFFPLKDFLVGNGWENAFAWGTLLFFIAVPIIGIITWIIRKIAKAKGNRRMIRLSFGSLWVIGWISVILLISSLSRDFRYNNKNLSEQEINLSNPLVNKLEVTSVSPLEKYTRSHWLRFEPFEGLQEDTAYIKNFDVRIMKSTSDSFKVTVIKTASGRTRTEAESLASMIQFNGAQKDSILQLDKGIAVNKIDKFRNQRIVLTIYVPVGKHIKIDRSVAWFNNVNMHFGIPWDENSDWDFESNDEAHGWVSNTEYEMKADGRLYTLDGREAGTPRHTRIRMNSNDFTVPNNPDNYRYENGQPMNKIDSMKQKLDMEKQRIKDSIRKSIEKSSKELEKLGSNDDDNDDNDESTTLNTYRLPGYGPMLSIN